MLNQKQIEFCNNYLSGMTQEQAYKLAYSIDEDKTTNGAYRLMRNEEVREYIKEKNEALFNERVADLQECLEVITDIIRDENSSKSERMKALDMRLKTLAAYVDKQDINLKTTITVDVED